MTAETGTSPDARACECEMQMIEACRAVCRQIRRVSSVNGPWLVVTTGGRRPPVIPRDPAMSGPSSVWSWIRSTSAMAS